MKYFLFFAICPILLNLTVLLAAPLDKEGKREIIKNSNEDLQAKGIIDQLPTIRPITTQSPSSGNGFPSLSGSEIPGSSGATMFLGTFQVVALPVANNILPAIPGMNLPNGFTSSNSDGNVPSLPIGDRG